MADVINYCKKGKKFDYVYDSKYNADTSRDWYRDLSRNSDSDAGSVYAYSSYDVITIYIIIAIAATMFLRLVAAIIVIYCDRQVRRIRRQQAEATTTVSESQSQDTQHQFQMTHILSSLASDADQVAIQTQQQLGQEDFKEVYSPTHASNRLPPSSHV